MLAIAISNALAYPSISTSGCKPLDSNLPASCINSAANNMHPVTPSPAASSCASPRLTNAFAAGCFIINSETILAPSFVIATSPLLLYIILSSPFGPYVRRRIFPNAIAAEMSFC